MARTGIFSLQAQVKNYFVISFVQKHDHSLPLYTPKHFIMSPFDKEIFGFEYTHVYMNVCFLKDTMPVERMRMRPWLEEQINSSQIPGLKWVSKVSSHFS